MTEFSPKKYYIKTFGCQANIADSNTMAGILESLGFEEIVEPKADNDSEATLKILNECDLFIVNTCSVRQKSEDKVYGLGKLLKNISKKPFIVISGCMVGSVTGERKRYEFNELQEKTPWADYYMNPHQIFDLPDILLKNDILDEWAIKKYDPNKVNAKLIDKKHAFVNISYGCDNFCTFCVVPYARGAEVSRSKEEILREVQHLSLRGISEITLCGQNVNSWGLEKKAKFKIRTGSDQPLPFAKLLREISKIEKITKIGFISSNPFDFTNDLIQTLKNPKISNYLHIAVQSGNNQILKKMNRRHTIEQFMDLISRIRSVKPNIELGTDLIVGFPGETTEQFKDTVDLVERIEFNVAFISKYSPRKGTLADKLYKDDISLDEKKRRHTHLTNIWKQHQPKPALVSL